MDISTTGATSRGKERPRRFVVGKLIVGKRVVCGETKGTRVLVDKSSVRHLQQTESQVFTLVLEILGSDHRASSPSEQAPLSIRAKVKSKAAYVITSSCSRGISAD